MGRVLVIALGLLTLLPACGGSDVDRDAGPTPPFTGIDLADYSMVDINPASPTFQQARSLADTSGKVMLLYMVSFA
jgi:hypothetical protein